MPRPAVFFDRDGVINVSPGDGYVLSWEQFQFAPGALAATRICAENGYALVLVTSQQGVGKGKMTQAALDDIHARMQATLAVQGAAFDAIEACTHLAGTCTCRKPSPEMIQRAAVALDLDLSRSWLIGDHDRDIQMAMNAGVPNTIRVLSHHAPAVPAQFTIASTEQLPELLRRVL
jgi:D-glycero-D-manno-heptose 1,7-bisphosphate phosphatase